MKLTAERKWFLNRYTEFGWSSGPMGLSGIKKWDAHAVALIKSGLVETEGEGLAKMYRLTDAGRAALASVDEKLGDRG